MGELYARRAVERAEIKFWSTDVTDLVAAEVSAVQNISHARAVGQVQYARTLCERLPEVAQVFVRGWIDFRMVTTIIARTQNVDAELMPALDAAIARHVEKWMKLSKPKLQDRIDLWVAKFDPAGVRVPPAVEDNRYLDVDPGTCAGMAFSPNTVQLRSIVIRGRRSGWGHGLWCERLAAHLRTLRLTTRGLARRRRLGLIRWVSLVIAHCHRVAIASWL